MIVVVIVVAAVVAVVDWTAVITGRRAVESVAKPLVMVALIAVALTVDADPAGARWWIVAGLACGILGDVFLLPHVDRFVEGLAAFLIGHVLYVVAFLIMFDGVVPLVVGVVVAATVFVVMAPPIVRSVAGHRLHAPVTAYMGVTGAVVMLGVATGRLPIALGAVMFAVSDGLLGSNRFVAPAPRRRVLIHVLYHLGQAGIVVGLAA